MSAFLGKLTESIKICISLWYNYSALIKDYFTSQSLHNFAGKR